MPTDKRIALLLGAAVLLAGCTTSAEREDSGKPADTYADTSNVTVYRNVDNIPNVAMFCAGPYRFAATLNSADGKGRGQLLRLYEDDYICDPTAESRTDR